MKFSLTEHDLNAIRILGLWAMVILWVLGVKAITSPGKLFEGIWDFFHREIDRKTYLEAQGNKKHDEQMLGLLDVRIRSDDKPLYNRLPSENAVLTYMNAHNLHSDHTLSNITRNLVIGTQNTYWIYKKAMKYSWKIVDPIIGCATCMPSVHTLIVYTMVCFLMKWHWNPFVWIFVAVAATFPSEVIYQGRAMWNELYTILKKKSK